MKKYKGGWESGNHRDVESGEFFWISGVKRNGADRHRFGSGKIFVEADAVSHYLRTVGASDLDPSLHEVTHSIVQTDVEKFERIENISYRSGAGQTTLTGS